MDEDVALMRIVIFLGIPGIAVSGVDILLNLIVQTAQILRCAAQYATLKAGEASLGHKITDSRNSTTVLRLPIYLLAQVRHSKRPASLESAFLSEAMQIWVSIYTITKYSTCAPFYH